MSYATLDFMTKDWGGVLQNPEILPDLITYGARTNMERWYNVTCKPEMLRLIETGSPESDIPKNIGRYRYRKIKEHGIDHGLGVLSGKLYSAVISTQPNIRVTRGNEVRLSIKFDKPFYFAAVHEGGNGRLPRRFVTVAVDKTLPKLLWQLSRMFDGIDLTRPYAEVSSSLVVSTG